MHLICRAAVLSLKCLALMTRWPTWCSWMHPSSCPLCERCIFPNMRMKRPRRNQLQENCGHRKNPSRNWFEIMLVRELGRFRARFTAPRVAVLLTLVFGCQISGVRDVSPVQTMLLRVSRPGEQNRPLRTIGPDRRRALVVCANRHIARQLNAQTPLRVDDVTTLQSVVAMDAVLLYNQSVEVDVQDVTSGDRTRMEATIRSNVCSLSEMRLTISFGGTYAYIWSDRSGRLIHRVRIDRCP